GRYSCFKPHERLCRIPGVDVASEVKSLPGIPQLDGDPDGVQGQVGRAELGTEVVAVLANAVNDLAGLLHMLMRLLPLVVTCRHDREHQADPPAQGQRFRRRLSLGALHNPVMTALAPAWA